MSLKIWNELNMPIKELERLQAVDRFLKLKISSELEMQEIVSCAAEICGTPIALVTLLTEDTQHIKFKVGTDLIKTARADAFCNHTVLQDGVMVVPDAGKDPRFADNPLHTGEVNIQFYAGVPLTTSDGINLGSLCVIDHQPKSLSHSKQRVLAVLAKQVVHILEFEHSLEVMKNQFIEARANELKIRSFFESSRACHLLIGADMSILYFNKALSEFLRNYHHEEIAIGLSVLDFVADDFLETFTRSFNKALSGQHVNLEHSLEHAGETIWWQFNYSPAYDKFGKIIGVSYSALDVSDLKKSQIDADQKRDALNRIALVQSHDIRGPLSSIIGLVELLKLSDLQQVREEILMLEQAVKDLDGSIRAIVSDTMS
jgi:PAS domain S-box-containing protein